MPPLQDTWKKRLLPLLKAAKTNPEIRLRSFRLTERTLIFDVNLRAFLNELL